MALLKLELANLADVEAFLERLENLRSFKEPLDETGRILMDSGRLNFQSGGRPAKWAPLKPLTLLNRRQGSSSPLQDTGALKQSVMGRSTGNVYRLTDEQLEFGTNKIYANVHQFGATIKPKRGKFLRIPAGTLGTVNLKSLKKGVTLKRYIFLKQVTIPARPFLMIQDEDVEKITRIFGGWLKRQLETP